MEEYTNYLVHYGVRGMKWKKRKARPVEKHEYYSTHYNPVTGKPMYRQKHTASSGASAAFKNTAHTFKAVGTHKKITERNERRKRRLSRGKAAVSRLFGR